MSSDQRHGQGKPEVEASRLGQEVHEDSFFKGWVGGPVAGSLKATMC